MTVYLKMFRVAAAFLFFSSPLLIPQVGYGTLPESHLNEPLCFQPILMERIWGGRRLELFGKMLPPATPIGESWEIADRPEAQSIVQNGPLKGKSLHELWLNFRESIFGCMPDFPQFPILIKLIDAKQRLSVQVHPNEAMAALLKAEPKTEMWYFIDTYGDGDIFAGLKRGVTAPGFIQALNAGSVAEKIHRLVVNPGQAFFIPSGRIHAIGAGNLILEVQQNSDTTYRVFDWNRLDSQGKPRELHIEKSLQCIDFYDYEPSLINPKNEMVLSCSHFQMEEWLLSEERSGVEEGQFAIFACLSGEVACGHLKFVPGDLFLMPAHMEQRQLVPLSEQTKLLRITYPQLN